MIATTAALPPGPAGAMNDGPTASCSGNVSLPVGLPVHAATPGSSLVMPGTAT